MIKLKFICNSATLDITNSVLDTIVFGPEEVLWIVDLSSLGYNKIKQGILQQHLSKYYRLEKADSWYEQFNKFIHTLKEKRQQEETKQNYPWLDPSDERKIYDRK